MKKLFVIISLWLIATLARAEDPTILFNQANEAYRQKKYDEAIVLYQKVLANGHDNGNLLFNLGNAYYRKNDVGRAILFYERAHRMIPRDSDLNFNLRYAKSHVVQNTVSADKSFLLALVDFLARFYSKGDCIFISVVIGIFFSLLWLILFALDVAVSTRLLTIIVGFFFFAASITIFMVKDWDERNMAVVLKESKAYFEPREDATVHFNLSEGSEVRLIESDEGWVKIKRADGKLGWLPAQRVEKI